MDVRYRVYNQGGACVQSQIVDEESLRNGIFIKTTSSSVDSIPSIIEVLNSLKDHFRIILPPDFSHLTMDRFLIGEQTINLKEVYSTELFTCMTWPSNTQSFECPIVLGAPSVYLNETK